MKEGARRFGFDPQFWGGRLMFGLLMLEVGRPRGHEARPRDRARDPKRGSCRHTLHRCPVSRSRSPPGPRTLWRVTTTTLSSSGLCFRQPKLPRRRGRRRGQEHSSSVADGNISGELENTVEYAVLAVELAGGMNHYACSNSQNGLRFITGFLARYEAGHAHLDLHQRRTQPAPPAAHVRTDRASRCGWPSLWHQSRRHLRGRSRDVGGRRLAPRFYRRSRGSGQRREYGIRRRASDSVLHAGASASPANMLSRTMADLDLFVRKHAAA